MKPLHTFHIFPVAITVMPRLILFGFPMLHIIFHFVFNTIFVITILA